MSVKQYPVFITVRDRLEWLQGLVQWLEGVGQRSIYLIDNDSTYPPLLTYLNECPHHVIRLGRNLGHRSAWLSGSVQRIAHGQHYIVSDPDVTPDAECPTDLLDHLRSVLDEHPGVHKVGLGLRIDDLPAHNPLAADVVAWEQRFWADEVSPGLFNAPVDTTFAMYRPLRHRPSDSLALRTGAPYVGRHMPWYSDPENLSEDERYYRAHADHAFSNWDRNVLPRWKRRWLNSQTG